MATMSSCATRCRGRPGTRSAGPTTVSCGGGTGPCLPTSVGTAASCSRCAARSLRHVGAAGILEVAEALRFIDRPSARRSAVSRAYYAVFHVRRQAQRRLRPSVFFARRRRIALPVGPQRGGPRHRHSCVRRLGRAGLSDPLGRCAHAAPRTTPPSSPRLPRGTSSPSTPAAPTGGTGASGALTRFRVQRRSASTPRYMSSSRRVTASMR